MGGLHQALGRARARHGGAARYASRYRPVHTIQPATTGLNGSAGRYLRIHRSAAGSRRRQLRSWLLSRTSRSARESRAPKPIDVRLAGAHCARSWLIDFGFTRLVSRHELAPATGPASAVGHRIPTVASLLL